MVGFPDSFDDFDDAMDLWGLFMFFFLAFLIMSCCGYCCTRKQRGAVLSTPVVVTSTTQTVPGSYTVTQLRANAYPTQAYATLYPPQRTITPMPMPTPMPASQPPAAGVQPYMAPYPTMNPPPYDVAVNDVGAGQLNTTAYTKQAPYNPNYNV